MKFLKTFSRKLGEMSRASLIAASLAALVGGSLIVAAATIQVDDLVVLGGLVSNETHVNKVTVTSGATGTAPILAAGGSGADANVKIKIQGNGTGIAELGQTACTATASSNAGTCNGQKGTYTTASLSTAHSAASTAQVITNSSVTASSVVLCSIGAYSGTIGTNGNPTVICIPSSNTITATIVNAADTNALSGTVGINFFVVN